MRTARASGWRRHASIASLRADQQAALRAAQQLVGAEAHDRRAGAHRAAHRRLLGQQLDVVGQHARADVVDDRHPEPAQRLDLDLLGEAEGAEVRRVRAQDRRRCARPAPPRSRPAACGWWSRPRPAAPRPAPTTSGMRKPPPISMSCPRETTTSRPGPASAAAASSTAAAQLLTASPACAPVTSRSSPSTCAWREPALAGGQIELEVRVALGRRRHRGAGARGQRRAPEVRVHHDAGGVEHAPQRGPEPLARPRDEVHVGGVPGEDLRAPLRQLGPRHRRRQPVDRRQLAQSLAHARGRGLGHGSDATRAARRRPRALAAPAQRPAARGRRRPGAEGRRCRDRRCSFPRCRSQRRAAPTTPTRTTQRATDRRVSAAPRAAPAAAHHVLRVRRALEARLVDRPARRHRAREHQRRRRPRRPRGAGRAAPSRRPPAAVSAFAARAERPAAPSR